MSGLKNWVDFIALEKTLDQRGILEIISHDTHSSGEMTPLSDRRSGAPLVVRLWVTFFVPQFLHL